MHKIILPQVSSGNYILNDQYGNTNKRMLEIESKDGKWQITSDSNAKIVNPKCIQITDEQINIVNTTDLFVNRIILKEYNLYELMLGEKEALYTLCCLPVYEDNWTHLDIRHTQEIAIGRNPNHQISYENNLVSDTHARIFLNNGKWMLENYDKKCGTFVNGNLVYHKAKFLSNGDTIFIMGLKIIVLGNSLYINNPAKKVHYDESILKRKEIKPQKIRKEDKEEEKYIELYSQKDYFYRSPRIINKIDKDEITIQAPPYKRTNDQMPLFLTLGSTLCMGAFSFISIFSTFSNIFSGRATVGESILSIISSFAMLLSMLFIPLLISRWEKKRDKKYEKTRQEKYRAYMNAKKKEIEGIKDKKRKILLKNYATTEECTSIILNKDKRLWERTIEDPDFLSIHLGMGDIPFDIRISYPEKQAFQMEEEDNLRNLLDDFTQDVNILKNAPVTISLKSEKIIAYIDKSKENINKFMQNLLIQLMAFQSYHDLKLVFLLKKDEMKKWEYVKMFPYVWNDEKDFRFFEDDVKNMEEISKYLEDEFSKRTKEDDNHTDDNKNFSPYYLIITDNYREIENLKIITNILQQKENVGFSIFCIAKDMMELPNACKKFIHIENKLGKVFSNEISSKSEIHFTFNNLNIFFFEKIKNMIANIPIRYKLAERNALPSHYSFLEMYNVGLIEQLNILDRWKNNDATLSLAAPIGIRANGKLLNLDIHEKFHGPHGLIAGSTGSGKSEFIITYILSLAINYHPDDVTFILIDYKGGGLSGAFQKQDVKLPHLVGTITNIDKEGLQRSLVSIQSELRRRQILFNEARELTDGGVIDIYKYQKLYHNGVLEKPIPHLLIICDEFAELKQQQPDFMSELVSVSRIGRSLGVHLILATQKPSGIVDEQIRSNSKFAICLKVQDKSDSSDVIERPDAAYLKQSGRFYIKVGNDDYFDIGQSGWSGAQYYPSDTTKRQEEDAIKFIANNGTVIKEINDYTKKTVESQGEQLPNIIKHMYDIATREGIKAESLWIEDIPENIYVKKVKDKYKFKKKSNSVMATIGEYDDPANQKQGIVNLDLVKGGNVIIYGNAESGKETLMSSIVYDLMTTYSSSEVWMYLLDFGTESLKIFDGCPHVGEVICANDSEKLKRFFDRIKEIVKERKQILTEYNGDYNFFLKTSGKSLPLITILINGYETFIENYEDVFDDVLLTLTREGSKTGITFVMATTASNDLRYRMVQNFKQKIALSLNEASEYGTIFEGLGNKRPARRFGRGLINLGEEIYDFQTAKSCEPEEYNVFIKEEIERVKQENKTVAEKIPILPDIVKADNFKGNLSELSNVPIGLRKKDIKPEFYDFKDNFITIITAKDAEEAMQFGSNIWQQIEKVQDVDIIILDPERKILSGRNELSENYEKLVSADNKKDSKHNICFVFGMNRLIHYLEQSGEDDDDDDLEGAEKWQAIIKQCDEKKNFSFVILDSADKIKEHNYDDWYKENVLESNIIWVGNGIEDQYLLDVNAPRKEIMDNCGCSFGYINKKAKTIMLKLLEMKERRDDDE